MDSRKQTQAHILAVHALLSAASDMLTQRAWGHDLSKLQNPELEAFDRETPILSGLTYGSPEYAACLERMKPALEHHYTHNRHHPEFHRDGIRGMNLLDLLEMVCDWMAAAKRHAHGNVLRSIEINQKRFGYSDELKRILLNTVEALQAQTRDGEKGGGPLAEQPTGADPGLEGWPS